MAGTLDPGRPRAPTVRAGGFRQDFTECDDLRYFLWSGETSGTAGRGGEGDDGEMTPDEIENHVFSLVRRGYDPAEVDDFLKDVATALAQAQLGVTPPATEPAVADEPTAGSAPDLMAMSGPDDFERLGEEVAAILRQAHESVATLRHRAEAEAALIRQNAEREAAAFRREADADRQAAAIALEAARTEAARVVAEVQRQADLSADSAAVLAAERTREVIEAARRDALGAITIQRNVRGRLEGTREDIDHALGTLVEEDEDLFATIDLTDATLAADAERGEEPTQAADLVPPPGQGPPTPPVPAPTRTTVLSVEDLPYASDDDDDEADDGEDATDVVALTDGDDDEGDGDRGGPPPVPPPPPGFDAGGGAAARPPAPAQAEPDDGGDDPLAQMVKNAVENALRRRKSDGEPADGNDP